MKQLINFVKNTEFKSIEDSFSFKEISVLLFYYGTYGHRGDRVFGYSSEADDLKAILKTDYDVWTDHLRNYRIVSTMLSFYSKTGT